MKSDYRTINEMIAHDYETRVPDYNLTPVFQLLTAVDPCHISAAVGECIIRLTDDLILEKTQNNLRLRDTMQTLKMIFRTFNGICFDMCAFDKQVQEQIERGEGLFSSQEINY